MAPPTEPDKPQSDQAWDADQRGETSLERLDRNWGDLLQELRVVQTGVQLLTGFLLTLPFQARFAQLHRFQQDVYLVTVSFAVTATAFLIAPVAIHRVLFRRHARQSMVTAAHYLAMVGTALLGSAVIGVVCCCSTFCEGAQRCGRRPRSRRQSSSRCGWSFPGPSARGRLMSPRAQSAPSAQHGS